MTKTQDEKFKAIIDGYIRKLSLSRDYGAFRYTMEDFLVDVHKDKRLKYAYDRTKVAMLIGSIFTPIHPQYQRTILRGIHFKDYEKVL